MKLSNTMMIFVGMFVVPLVLAFAVLKLEWLPENTVNQGQFVQPEVSLNDWHSIEPKPWSIGVLAAQQCDSDCLKQHEGLRKLYMALGKNRDKVDLVLLGAKPFDESGFKSYPSAPSQLKHETLYLIDQMGLVLLEYPVKAEPQANRMVQKGLMKDLKKLINYSRQ